MRLWLYIGSLLALTACSFDDATQIGYYSSKQKQTIVNGSRAPQTVVLSSQQKLSIGYIATESGRNYCTGSLISPRVAVTAEHCIYDKVASSVFFGIGDQPKSPNGFFPVTKIIAHPALDFAVLILGVDVSDAFSEIEYLGLNSDVVDNEWPGRWVDAAGFGDTYSSETGLFFAKVEIVDFDSELVVVDGHGKQGICYGDSGGPILWQDNIKSNPVIVAIEQWGDSSCVDRDYLVRVDLVADWVTSIANGDLPSTLKKCDGVPPVGQCDGDIRKWCTGGYQHEEACYENEQHCGWRGERIGYACLPQSCGELDYLGICDGDILKWCGSSGLRTKDCSEQGLSCLWESDELGYNCGGCIECGNECINIQHSLVHCGGCDILCAPENATGICESGTCQVNKCEEGFSDLDNSAANGCESLSLDVYSEGGCHSLENMHWLALLILLSSLIYRSRFISYLR